MISSLILQYAFMVCFLYKINAAVEAFTHDTSPEGEMMNFSRGLNYTQNENVRAILTESTTIQDQPFLMHHFSPKMKFSRIKRSKESRAKQKKFQKKKKSGKRKFGTKKRKQNKEKVSYMKHKDPNVSKHKSNKKFKKYIYKKNNQKSRKSPRRKSHVKNENAYLDSADFNEIFEMIKRRLPKIDKFWIKIKENSDEEKDIPKNLNSLGYNSTELYGEESNSLIGNTHAITNNSNIHFSKNVTNTDEIGNSIINSAQSTTPFKKFGESNISSIRSERKKIYHGNAVEKEKINELTTVKSRENFPIINSEKVSIDIRNEKEVMDTSSKIFQTANNVSKKKNQTKLQPLEISESPIYQVSRNFDKITVWKNNIQNRSTFNDLNWESSSESIIHTTNENNKHFETEDISIATVHYDSNNINTLDKITPSINTSGGVLQENHEEHHSEELNKIPNAESITKNVIEPNNTFFEFSKAWQYRNPKTERNLNKSSKTNILDSVVFEMTPGTLSSSDESDSFVRIHAFSENANHADLEDVLPEISRKLHSDIPKKYTDKDSDKPSYKFTVKPDHLTINRIKNDTIYKEGRDSNEETSPANVIPPIRFDNYDSSNKQNIASDSINNKHFKTDLNKESKLEEEENSLKYRMNDEIGVITTNPNRVANQTKILRYIFKGHLFSPNKTTELRKNNSNEGDSMPKHSKTHNFSDKFNSSSLFMPINFENGQIQKISIDPNLNTPPASKTHLKKSYEFEEVSSSTNIIKGNNASRNDALNDPNNLHVFPHNTGSFNTVSINDTHFQNDYQIFSVTDRDEKSNNDAKSIDQTDKKINNLENEATSVFPDPVFNELRDSKSLILQMSTTDNNSFDNYAGPSDTLTNELNYENSISGRNISNIFHPYNRSMYISAKRFKELHEIREADILGNKMSQEGENTNDKTISLKYPAISTEMHKYTPNHIQKNLGDTYFADGLSTLPNSSKHEFNTQRYKIYTEPANFTTNTSTETPDEIYEFKEIVISKNKSAEEKKRVQNITIYETTFTSLNVSPESDSSFMKEVPNSRYDKNSKDYSSEIIKNLERSISPDDHFNKQIKTTHVVQRSNTTTMLIEPIGDSYEAKQVDVLKNATVIEENFKNEVSSVNSFTETKLISDNGAPSIRTSTSAKAKNSSRDTVSQSQELNTIRSYPYQVNRIEETYKKEYTNKTLDALMEETLPAQEELYKNDFLAVQKMHLPKNTTYLRIIESYLPDNQQVLLANISDNATGMKGSNTTIAVSDSSTEETFTIFTDNVFETRDEIVISNSSKLENNSEFEEGSRINNSATDKVKGLDFLTTQDTLSSNYNLRAKNHTPEYLFRSHEQLNNTSNFITDTVSEVEQITNNPFDVFYEIREVIISPTKHIKKETNTENDFTTATHFTKSDSLIYPTKHSKIESSTGNKFTTATHFKELDSLNHSDVLNLQKLSSFDKINHSDFGSTGLLKQMYSNVSTNDKIRKNDNTTDLMINNDNTIQFLKSQTADMYTTTRTFNFENQGNAFTQKDIYRDNHISKNSFSLHNNKMENSPVSITPDLTNTFDKYSSNINFFDNKLEQSNGVKVQQISEAPVSTHGDLYNKNPLTVTKINLSTNNAEFQGVSEENSKEIQNNLPYQIFSSELGNTTIMINSETKQNFEQPISRVFVVKEIVVNSNNILDPENEIILSSKNSTIHYDRPFIKTLPITDINKNSPGAFDKHDIESSTDKAEIYYKMTKNIFSPNNITKQENNYEKVNIFNINVNQSDSLIKSKTHITNVDEKEDKASTESLYLQPAISHSMGIMRKNNLMTKGILQTDLSTPVIFDDFGFPSHNNVTNFNKNENSGDKINDVINEANLNKATVSPDSDDTSSNSTSLKSVNATNVPSNKTMVEENNMLNDSQSTFSITELYQLYDRNSTFLKGTFVSTKNNDFPESSTSLSNEILNDGMTSESLDDNISNTTGIFFSEILSSNMSKENLIALNDSVKLENKTENEHFSTIPVTVYENTFSLRTKDFNDIISFPVTENTINQTPSANTSFSFSDNIRTFEDFEKEKKDFYKTDEDSTENTESENVPTKFVFLENKTFDYLLNNFNEATLDSEDMFLRILNNNASNNESKELPIKGIFPVDFLQKKIIDAQNTESNISDVTRVITEISSATYDREEAFDLQKNIVFKNSKKNATFTNVHNDNSTIYTTRTFTKELLDVNETRNNSLNTLNPLFLRTNVDDKSRSISDANTPMRFIFIINNKVTDGSENIKNRWYSLNEGNDILERKISSIILPNKRRENDDTYSYIFEQNNRMVSSPKLKENPKFSFFEQKHTVTEHKTKPDFRKSYVENDSFIKSNKKTDKVKYDAIFMVTDNFNVKNNQANDYFRKDGDNDIKNQAFHPSSIGMNQLYFKSGDGDRYFYTKPHIETQNSEPQQSIKGINSEFMLKNNNDKVKITKDIFVVPRCFSKALRRGNYKFNDDGDEIDDIRKKHANQINIRITELEDKYSQLSSLSNPLENEIDFTENQFVNKKKNAYMSSELGAKIENTTKTKIKPFLFRQYPIFQRKLNEPRVKSVNNRMSSSVNTPEKIPVILTLFADQMNSEHKNPLNSNNKEAVNTKFYKFLQNREGGRYNPSGERYGKDWLWTNVEHRDGINIHISPAIYKLSSISIEAPHLNSIPENYEMTDTHKLQTNIDSDNFFPEKQRKLNQWINYNKFSQRNKRDLKQFNTFKNNPLFSSIGARNRKSNVDENVSEKINICSECLDVDEKSEGKTNFLGSKFLLQDELHETERNDVGETISETIKKDFAENVSETDDTSKLQNIIANKNDHFGPPEEKMRNQYNNAENSISHKLAGRFISFLNDKTASGTPMLASYLKDNHRSDAFRSKTLVNKDHTENIKRVITDEMKDSQSDFMNPRQSIVLKKQMSLADNTGFDLSDDEIPGTIKDKEKEYDLELSDDENANSIKDKEKEHDLELLDYENSDAMKDEEKEHDLELSDDENANIMRDKEKKQLIWKLFLPFFQSMNRVKDRKYMHQADKYT